MTTHWVSRGKLLAVALPLPGTCFSIFFHIIPVACAACAACRGTTVSYVMLRIFVCESQLTKSICKT
jgi:hypothetical protein